MRELGTLGRFGERMAGGDGNGFGFCPLVVCRLIVRVANKTNNRCFPHRTGVG